MKFVAIALVTACVSTFGAANAATTLKHSDKVLRHINAETLVVNNKDGSLVIYCAKADDGFYVTDKIGVMDEISSYCPTPPPKPATTK